jgi:hypothetical protein
LALLYCIGDQRPQQLRHRTVITVDEEAYLSRWLHKNLATDDNSVIVSSAQQSSGVAHCVSMGVLAAVIGKNVERARLSTAMPGRPGRPNPADKRMTNYTITSQVASVVESWGAFSLDASPTNPERFHAGAPAYHYVPHPYLTNTVVRAFLGYFVKGYTCYHSCYDTHDPQRHALATIRLSQAPSYLSDNAIILDNLRRRNRHASHHRQQYAKQVLADIGAATLGVASLAIMLSGSTNSAGATPLGRVSGYTAVRSAPGPSAIGTLYQYPKSASPEPRLASSRLDSDDAYPASVSSASTEADVFDGSGLLNKEVPARVTWVESKDASDFGSTVKHSHLIKAREEERLPLDNFKRLPLLLDESEDVRLLAVMISAFVMVLLYRSALHTGL